MRLEFIKLYETIKEKSNGSKVYLLVPPGNWGDALILYGTELFLNYFNLDYEVIHINSNLIERLKIASFLFKNPLVLVLGGGGWVAHYNHLGNTVRNIVRKYRLRNVIILPSTYAATYEIDNCIFFRRDNYESAENMPNSQFCHDLAFFIGSVNVGNKPTSEKCYAFRLDVESSNSHAILPQNIDLSFKGDHLSKVSYFFGFLSKYNEIHTDRLHIAIASCLLDKRVHLYRGNYFKNKSIFYSSIDGYYENKFFHDSNFVE